MTANITIDFARPVNQRRYPINRTIIDRKRPPLNQYRFFFSIVLRFTLQATCYRFCARRATCSTSVYVYPISLSYHASTFTSVPSTTRVIVKSASEAKCIPTISDETSGSSVTEKISFQRGSCAALVRNWFTSCAEVERFATKVTSTIEPVITGTRIEMPSNFPESAGNALVTAIAAPVDEGTILCAAALPSRKSFLFGPSTSDWLAVYP